MKVVHRTSTGSRMDEDLFHAYVDSGMDYSTSQSLATYSTYSEEEKIENRKISLNKILKKIEPSWKDIVDYVGGYGEIARLNLSKESIGVKYNLEIELTDIELFENNKFIAHIIMKGNKEYAFKYHGVSSENIEIAGKYDIENLSYPGIYNMVKSYKDGDNSGEGIKIIFKFNENKFIKENIETYLADIDNKFIEKALPYYETMIVMVNDLIHDNYYNQMDHMVEKRNKKIEEYRLCAVDFLNARNEIVQHLEKQQNNILNKLLKGDKKQEYRLIQFHYVYNRNHLILEKIENAISYIDIARIMTSFDTKELMLKAQSNIANTRPKKRKEIKELEKNMEIFENAALIDSELAYSEGFGSRVYFTYWMMLVESENRYGRDESHTPEFFNLLGIKTNCTDIVFDYSEYIE